jgi:crotonobetainyl-CoA:carnitine CoA-transferase CaiB-like acyl-CoA transferase
MCAISGFGQTGPDRLRAGHDLGYIARAGVLGYGGADGGPPAVPGAQMADIGAGSLFAVVGILAAVLERQRTGQGRYVDVSMTDGATAFIHMHLAARMLLGAQAKPLARGKETLNGGSPCYGVYETKDSRWLAVGALEPKFFHGVLAALELSDDLSVGGWDNGPDGRKTRAALEKAFASKTLAEWTALFRAKDLCVEPVLEGDEVLADPQLVARGLFQVHDGKTWLRTPLHLGEVAVKSPPALGAHTREALQEAGLAPAAIDALLTK